MKLALGLGLVAALAVVIFLVARNAAGGTTALWIFITLGWVFYFFVKKRKRD